MPMYREGEYAAGATTRKGNLKQAGKVVNKALAKSAAQKKAAAKKKEATTSTAGRGFNPTMPRGSSSASSRQVGGRAKEGLGKLGGGVGRVGSGEMKELKGTSKGSSKSYVKATGAVASKGQAIRKADAGSSAKRRISGTTRTKKLY